MKKFFLHHFGVGERLLMNEINWGKGLFRAAFSVTQYPFSCIRKVRFQGKPPCLVLSQLAF